MFLSLGICPACYAPAAAERSELHLGSGELRVPVRVPIRALEVFGGLGMKFGRLAFRDFGI